MAQPFSPDHWSFCSLLFTSHLSLTKNYSFSTALISENAIGAAETHLKIGLLGKKRGSGNRLENSELQNLKLSEIR